MLFAAITASAMGGVIEDSTEKYKANIWAETWLTPRLINVGINKAVCNIYAGDVGIPIPKIKEHIIVKNNAR